MMGLMSLKACEDCKMNLIYGDLSEKIVLADEAPLLQNMLKVCSEHENVSFILVNVLIALNTLIQKYYASTPTLKTVLLLESHLFSFYSFVSLLLKYLSL